MKKKKKLFIISILLVISSLMIGIDYGLSKNNKPPIFAIKSKVAKDGGTTEYLGLGYKIIDYNQLDGRQDVVFIPFLISGAE